MAEPLKFRDAVLSRVSPPDVLLVKLEEALKTTHKITQAGDASKIPIPKVMKHVVDTLSEVVKIEVRPLMIELFDRHITAVSDEYEMDEGDSEGLTGDEAAKWWRGMLDAQYESFAGEVRRIVGDEAVRKFVDEDEETEVLVDAILKKPIDDTGAMKIKLGVTPDQIQALVRKVHENWAEASEEAEPPSEEAAAPERKRTIPAKVEGSRLTEVARGLLEALYAYSGAKDQDLADALSISRPQINNYRHGRSNLNPNEAQAEALIALARKHAGGLLAAVEAFEAEVL